MGKSCSSSSVKNWLINSKKNLAAPPVKTSKWRPVDKIHIFLYVPIHTITYTIVYWRIDRYTRYLLFMSAH